MCDGEARHPGGSSTEETPLSSPDDGRGWSYRDSFPEASSFIDATRYQAPVVEIIEHLSVGSYQDALEPPKEIDLLLNVAEEHDLSGVDRPVYKVPVTDMKPIPTEQLEEAVRWIHDHIADKHILLFCNAGVGRSPSVAVAYLCCSRGWSFGEAVEFVARQKPDVSTLPELITRIDEIRGVFR